MSRIHIKKPSAKKKLGASGYHGDKEKGHFRGQHSPYAEPRHDLSPSERKRLLEELGEQNAPERPKTRRKAGS